mgnify:CR=1 FL=1
MLNRRDERINIGLLAVFQQTFELGALVGDDFLDRGQHVLGSDLVEAWQRRGIK